MEENNEEVIIDETLNHDEVIEEPIIEENIETPSIVNTPTEEQLAFQAKVEALGIEKGDVVLFRNSEIGRVDATNFISYDMVYRIYVKIGDVLVTLNEELIDVSGNKKHDAQKILSSDFTAVKKEIEFTEIVLTKEEAEAKLSQTEGQTIIID